MFIRLTNWSFDRVRKSGFSVHKKFHERFTKSSRIRVHERRFPKYFSFFCFGERELVRKNFQNFVKVTQLVWKPIFLHMCYVPSVWFYIGTVPHIFHVAIICYSLRLFLSLFSPLPVTLSTFVLVQLGRGKSKEKRSEIYIIVQSNTDFIWLINLNPTRLYSFPSDLTIFTLSFCLDKLPHLDRMNSMKSELMQRTTGISISLSLKSLLPSVTT